MHFRTIPSIAENTNEFKDVFQDDGTVIKPNLIYVATTRANGIRFYVKVNGTIRVMKEGLLFFDSVLKIRYLVFVSISEPMLVQEFEEGRFFLGLLP